MLTEKNFNPLKVNPLATRYVAPGRLPWIGKGDSDLDFLVERFQALGRCCQIVGPHGSGKTTLLEHLVPRLGNGIMRVDVNGQTTSDIKLDSQNPRNQMIADGMANPRLIWWFTLRRGSAVMARFEAFWKQTEFGGLLVIDGGEQLNWWRRRQLSRWARRRRCGLLVTAHTDLGLNTLLRTQVTPHLAKEVVRQAFRQASGEAILPGKIEEIDWESWLDRRQGNLRECLMDLYDQVETLMREAK
jgi:energy-coupling factor transporter ATP-binding protein EcfA2